MERERAKYAYECVESIASEYSHLKKNYKSYVRKLPALIKANGLAGAIAFVFSKKDNDKSKSDYAYKLIYEQSQSWLMEKSSLGKLLFKNGYDQTVKNHVQPEANQVQDDKRFIENIINLDIESYRLATTELLALYKWMARFAEGMLGGDEKDG